MQGASQGQRPPPRHHNKRVEAAFEPRLLGREPGGENGRRPPRGCPSRWGDGGDGAAWPRQGRKKTILGCIRTRHPKQQTWCHPHPHLSRPLGSTCSRPLGVPSGTAPSGAQRGAAGRAPATATQCGGRASRRLCGRPVATQKPARPRLPPRAHPPWAPAPGSRSVLVAAFQTWPPSRQSRSAADLLISALRAGARPWQPGD